MHTVILSTNESAKENPESSSSLLRALRDEQQLKTRIYRTYVAGDVSVNKWFVFVTTSKDVHLRLGSFSRATCFILGKFLKGELARLSASQLLLVFKDEKKGLNEGLLVTLTREAEDYVFTLSPAH
jgi:hypothetical protein